MLSLRRALNIFGWDLMVILELPRSNKYDTEVKRCEEIIEVSYISQICVNGERRTVSLILNTNTDTNFK